MASSMLSILDYFDLYGRSILPDPTQVFPVVFQRPVPEITVLVYAILMKYGEYAMKGKPFHRGTMKVVTFLHNFVLFLESIVLLGGLLHTLVYAATVSDFTGIYCGISTHGEDVDEMVARMMYWLGWFYVSRYHEMLDTVLLVLRGKPVTWLSLVHHGIMVYCGMALVETGFTTNIVPCLINAFIHVVMYLYFAVTAVQPGALQIIRRSLTTMQIAQFVFIISYYMLWAYFKENGVPCRGTWFAWYNAVSPVSIILVLFVNFFYKQYISGSKPKRKVA